MDAKKWLLLFLVVLGGRSSTDVRCTRNCVNTLRVPDEMRVNEGRGRAGKKLPVLTAHDRSAMTEVAEHILHCALAQCDPHTKGQLRGVHLLVAFAVEKLASSGILSRLTADPLKANCCQETCPHRGVVVRDVHLTPCLSIAPKALLLLFFKFSIVFCDTRDHTWE